MIKWYDLLRFLTAILFLCGFTPSVYGATIDVMIVYDSSAKTWVTGQGGMNAFAVDAVARMNQAAANSNVNLTFRLAHAADIAYTYNSSSGLGTALDNLQSGTGNFSIVHQWRDTYGADLVALLVDTGSAFGTVGVGYLLSTYSGLPDYGFTTTAIRSVNTSHTLTHEIGHNLGCQHSKFQKADPGPNSDLNSYSAGWYFTGTNALKYHTIMAYNSDGYGNSYSEAPLFSTPLLTHRGTVAGDALDGDNARNIRETMDIVAAYRTAAVTCTYTLTPTDQRLSPLSGTGSVTVTASSGSCSWTGTSNDAWITISSGGSGTGSGTVSYSVAANNGAPRSGTMTIGGQTVILTQAGPVVTNSVGPRNTIKGKTTVQGRYKKQSGGRGQFGDTWLDIEPLPRGGGFEFVDRIVGGVIPGQYRPAVEKGIVEAMAEGVVAGYPVVDIRVSLTDGSYHTVDSSEMAFKIAGSLGFKKGVLECQPTLLEPIVNIMIEIPDEYMGDVIGDLNSRRGKVLGMDSIGHHQVIKGQVPLAEILKYAPDLRSMTSGRGTFTYEHSHYEEVPAYIAEKIIAESKKEDA